MFKFAFGSTVLASAFSIAGAFGAQAASINFTVEQYLGYQTNNLAALQSYASSNEADYTVQTDVIDYTDDPGGFSGIIPGSKRWPAAEAANYVGTGGINNVFFARITADFLVTTADDYTFQTYNDDGVFLLIDGDLVINDTGYHGEAQFSGTKSLGTGAHSIELFFFENGGEASLEFTARQGLGAYGLVGGSGSVFEGVAPVPIPGSLALLGGAIAAFAMAGYRSRH